MQTVFQGYLRATTRTNLSFALLKAKYNYVEFEVIFFLQAKPVQETLMCDILCHKIHLIEQSTVCALTFPSSIS